MDSNLLPLSRGGIGFIGLFVSDFVVNGLTVVDDSLNGNVGGELIALLDTALGCALLVTAAVAGGDGICVVACAVMACAAEVLCVVVACVVEVDGVMACDVVIVCVVIAGSVVACVVVVGNIVEAAVGKEIEEICEVDACDEGGTTTVCRMVVGRAN